MSNFFEAFAENGADWWPVLLQAMVMTALLSVVAFAAALMLGLVLALCRQGRSAAVRHAVAIFIEIVRGVPLLAVLFLIYFGLPGIGIAFGAFTAAVLGLSITYAAQIAELFRAGMSAVPTGQREAALAAGFTPLSCFRLIILPQVMRIITPPLIVTFVSLLKDSSLASLITVDELVLAGRSLATEYFLPLQIFLAVGLCYFVIAWPFSRLSRHLAAAAPR